MRKLSLSVFGLMAITGAFAQAKEDLKKPATIAIHVAAFDFTTPQLIRKSSLGSVMSNNQWTKLKDQNIGMGISYIKGISNYFDFSANYYLTSVDYPFNDGTPEYGSSFLLHEADASVHMKLLTDKSFFNPYLSAGIGASAYKGGRFDAFMPLGVGAQIKLSPSTFIFSNFQYRVPVTERANYHFLATAGIGFSVAKKKVPPPPPAPVAPVVVAPVDTDGDGIPDADDKCPTVAGTVKYAGCPVPDTDKDGVNDDVDQCPTVPGLARLNGCPIPDKDADGINDEEDKCPDVAGVARYQGCPIPDTDGDGVNDEEDKCKDTPGPASNYGCPELKFTPENISFKTGSAVLTSVGVKELKSNILPAIAKIGGNAFEIQGHTDNTGSAAVNDKLSKKRAEAVKAWLVKNGVPATQMETVGKGSSEPVADNKTAEGRKKNRRVQFKLLK